MLPCFSSYVEVYTETRTASLDEVFFPSLVVCNVNPMRKSFMYDVLKVRDNKIDNFYQVIPISSVTVSNTDLINFRTRSCRSTMINQNYLRCGIPF